MIMRIAIGPIGGTFGIVEIAGMGAADAGQKTIQRLHAVAGVAIVRRRPKGLGLGDPDRGRCQTGPETHQESRKLGRAWVF